jgi:hypothetical protein
MKVQHALPYNASVGMGETTMNRWWRRKQVILFVDVTVKQRKNDLVVSNRAYHV